jgi:P27 family predicted phage terminase small subunit
MAGTSRSGGRPYSAAMRALTGTPTRERHRDEPRYAAGTPEMPAFVASDAAAAAKWQVLAERISGVGVLTEAHGEMLALLCTAWADLERARAEFAAGGYRHLLTEVYMTPAGEMAERSKANPLVGRIEKLNYQVARFLSEFGLTPMTSAKVKTTTPKTDEPDPFAEFLSPAKRIG